MEIQTGEMDRISELPESIIHLILSLLSYTHAELVPMSILSKRWFDIISSFPILDLNFSRYHFRGSKESFYKYVEYTTSRFCQQNVTAHKLELDVNIHKPAELGFLDKYFQLVLNNGVRELSIHFNYYPGVQKYRLPDVLLSVSVLKYLKIDSCELPSSLMVDALKFKSLIRLKLDKVQIEDEVIKHLTTSCPLLEEFGIRDCHGFNRFCVNEHQSLQKIWISYNYPVERIDIEAPNLSYLYLDNNGYFTGAPQMNLASCKKLTTLDYVGYTVPSNDFTDFLTNFPFIENLLLSTYPPHNILKLSSHSLKTLVVHSGSYCNAIELNTPNLVLFVHSFTDYLWHSVYLLRDSNSLESCMQFYSEVSINHLWFEDLRFFLDKRNGFKVLNLYIQIKPHIETIHSQDSIELEELIKATELPPYELDHLELQLDADEKSSAYVVFVDAVLWFCRPRSLTFRSYLPLTNFDDVVKFTYEKLLEQEDQGNTTILIVTSSSSSDAQKHFRDLKLMSMALEPEVNAISFIKQVQPPPNTTKAAPKVDNQGFIDVTSKKSAKKSGFHVHGQKPRVEYRQVTGKPKDKKTSDSVGTSKSGSTSYKSDPVPRQQVSTSNSFDALRDVDDDGDFIED